MEGEEVKDKKPRSEKQKAATAKALEVLKQRRQIARDVIDEGMKQEVMEAEDRLVFKVMERIKKEREEDKPVASTKVKKQVVMQEEESSSEEEVVVVKKRKPTQAAPVQPTKPVMTRPSTGNKILDRLYGLQ